jgi:8-oxo-dGTP diphosphatase
MKAFRGAKIALLAGGKILTMQRDSWPWLNQAGKWDLPGGGREGAETPEQCICREVKEELGIVLDPKAIAWKQSYPSVEHPGEIVYFMAAPITDRQIAAIKFGNEGQGWKMMAINDFYALPNAIEVHKIRLKRYLDNQKAL